MTPFDPLTALAIPAEAFVDRRVPKTLLIENGAPVPADKRRIREGIEELTWLATLKPTTTGVAEYRDADREYLEIAIVRLALRANTRAERLVELVHRAIPYPMLLIVWRNDETEFSLAHKRWSRSEAGKTVIDGEIVAARFTGGCTGQPIVAFRDALALASQPRSSLHALYQGWINTVQALRAAEITGTFSLPSSKLAAADRAAALQKCRQLDDRIAEICAAADKERQVSRRVEMNLELARLRTDREAARAKL